MMLAELKELIESNPNPTLEQMRQWLLELVTEVDDLDHDVRKKFKDLGDISRF